MLGDLMILDDDDERLWLKRTGASRRRSCPSATRTTRRKASGAAAEPGRPGPVLRPDRPLRRPGRERSPSTTRTSPPTRMRRTTTRQRGRRGRRRRNDADASDGLAKADDAAPDEDRPRTEPGRRSAPGDPASPRDEAARRGAHRTAGSSCRGMAPGVPRAVAGGRRHSRPVRARPHARLLRARPAPAVQHQHVRPADRGDHDPFPGHRQGDGVARADAAGREQSRCSGRWAAGSRSTRAAGTSCSSRAAWAWPGCGSLADEALADGPSGHAPVRRRDVRARSIPRSLLPDEVEYVVATDDGSLGHHGRVTELVPEYEAWADQAFACGPQPMLAPWRGWPAGRDGRLGVARLGRKRGGTERAARLAAGSPRAWLQVTHGAEHGLRRRRLPGLRRHRR